MRQPLFLAAMAALGLGLVLLVLNHDSGRVLGMASGDFASLVMLGTLAAVLSAAFVGGRHRGGPLLRMAALWLAILVLLVGGYQYRYELQDVASRLTAGLVPGSPLTVVGGEGGTRVMLEKSAGGHFEVLAEINGRSVRALVDTGATSTVLTARDAARAGYDPGSLVYDVPVATANGIARAARVEAAEITVGAITRRGLPLLVAEPGRLGQSLLGMNFLSSLSGFDVRGDRLILHD
ncbi:TIGR02281 family clan AA aspartic protease [Aquibium sp. A9E412]|uniref:retropepsin-like aspartic protease family protein n=1 Tax=Aquibium sp. A9E412 TaxID=2976767 RepID=UPI0025B12120|nr:TIGR02281 family clan AA aspartic protease [Aquibium sp. A9E412]MDN2568240.1 TIGR02281 family clan AA aspartic protease [Aquibium sp. A9E412]